MSVINYFADLPLNFFRSFPYVFELTVRLVLNPLLAFSTLAIVLACISTAMLIMERKGKVQTDPAALKRYLGASIMYLLCSTVMVLFIYAELQVEPNVLSYLLIVSAISTVYFCGTLWGAIFKLVSLGIDAVDRKLKARKKDQEQ